MDNRLKIIGIVESKLKSRAQCPKQPDANIPPSKLTIDQRYIDAIDGLEVGEDIYVLTWLHKGNREVLKCHPRGDLSKPMRGIFATRSPDRPNPIGLHRVTILGIEKNVLTIHPIEVLDNTPVVDIKPVDFGVWKKGFGPYIDSKIGEKIRKIGERAWQRGLISGFNGNISVRFKDMMIITRTGCNKGMISAIDLIAYDLRNNKKLSDGDLSSEWKMHYEIYMNRKDVRAILHTHPPYLLAAIKSSNNFLQHINVYESEIFLPRIGLVEPLIPGSEELASAVARVACSKDIVFLKNHGLVCVGKDLIQCISLSEEIEQLAKIFFLLIPSTF